MKSCKTLNKIKLGKSKGKEDVNEAKGKKIMMLVHFNCVIGYRHFYSIYSSEILFLYLVFAFEIIL